MPNSTIALYRGHFSEYHRSTSRESRRRQKADKISVLLQNLSITTNLNNSFRVWSKVEIAKDKQRRFRQAVCAKTLKRILQSPSPCEGVRGRSPLGSHEVRGVMKQMNVHQVKRCVANTPACTKKALAGPLALQSISQYFTKTFSLCNVF